MGNCSSSTPIYHSMIIKFIVIEFTQSRNIRSANCCQPQHQSFSTSRVVTWYFLLLSAAWKKPYIWSAMHHRFSHNMMCLCLDTIDNGVERCAHPISPPLSVMPWLTRPFMCKYISESRTQLSYACAVCLHWKTSHSDVISRFIYCHRRRQCNRFLFRDVDADRRAAQRSRDVCRCIFSWRWLTVNTTEHPKHRYFRIFLYHFCLKRFAKLKANTIVMVLPARQCNIYMHNERGHGVRVLQSFICHIRWDDVEDLLWNVKDRWKRTWNMENVNFDKEGDMLVLEHLSGCSGNTTNIALLRQMTCLIQRSTENSSHEVSTTVQSTTDKPIHRHICYKEYSGELTTSNLEWPKNVVARSCRQMRAFR